MAIKKNESGGEAYSSFGIRKITTVSQPLFDVAKYAPNGPTTALGGTEFACTEESYFTDTINEVATPQKLWFCFSNDATGSNEWQINSVSTTKWYWGKFYSPQPLIIQSFGIDVNNNQYHPAKIRLYGSNNDSQYTLISNEQAIEQKAGLQAVTLQGTTAYQYFKLEMLPASTTASIIYRIRYQAKMIQDYMAMIKLGGNDGS